jgi:hypothetical protein
VILVDLHYSLDLLGLGRVKEGGDLIVFARGDPGVQAGEEARPFVASGRIRR